MRRYRMDSGSWPGIADVVSHSRHEFVVCHHFQGGSFISSFHAGCSLPEHLRCPSLIQHLELDYSVGQFSHVINASTHKEASPTPLKLDGYSAASGGNLLAQPPLIGHYDPIHRFSLQKPTKNFLKDCVVFSCESTERASCSLLWHIESSTEAIVYGASPIIEESSQENSTIRVESECDVDGLPFPS